MGCAWFKVGAVSLDLARLTMSVSLPCAPFAEHCTVTVNAGSLKELVREASILTIRHGGESPLRRGQPHRVR